MPTFESSTPKTEGDHGSIAPGGDGSPLKAIKEREEERINYEVAEKFARQEGCAWGQEVELFGAIDCDAHIQNVTLIPQKRQLRVTAEVYWQADLPKLNERADIMAKKAFDIYANGGEYPRERREGRIEIILQKNSSGEYVRRRVKRLGANGAVQKMTDIGRTWKNADWFWKALGEVMK